MAANFGRAMRYAAVTISILFGLFDSAGATRIYISPIGSDATGDGSRANPYKTLDYVGQENVETGRCSPGDTIWFVSGAGNHGYQGYIEKFQGADNKYITIMGDSTNRPVIDVGDVGGACFTLTDTYPGNDPDMDSKWLRFEHIIFKNATTMHVNIDDGGSSTNMLTPAHHINFYNCKFENETYSAEQYSGIKMAGLDTFLVDRCEFVNIRRQGIDAVGVHEGIIRNCIFRDHVNPDACSGEGYGIILKGGSRHVLVERNIFMNLSYTGVSLGNTTTNSLFRPPFGTLDGGGDIMNYENKDCWVYRNVFINVGLPIIFAHSIGGKVYNNTMYNTGASPDLGNPCGGSWYVVQIRNYHDPVCGWDYNGTTIAASQGGEFRNNISVFGTTAYGQVYNRPDSCIIASAPSFMFSNNLFYCATDPAISMPQWGTTRCLVSNMNNFTGSPGFVGGAPSIPADFLLAEGSPAIGRGLSLSEVPRDFFNQPFREPARAIGAFESREHGAPPSLPQIQSIIPR